MASCQWIKGFTNRIKKALTTAPFVGGIDPFYVRANYQIHYSTHGYALALPKVKFKAAGFIESENLTEAV
jgi:hypothetical protein